MRSIFTGTLALLAAGFTPAPAVHAEPPAPASTAEPAAKNTAAAGHRTFTDDMTKMLRKAGFTDIQVMPNSILVRAKDRAGNPVAMAMNPASMTEMVTLDSHAGEASAGNGARHPLTGSGTFMMILPSDNMASTLIGTRVRNPAGAAIGTIKDIAIDHGGIHAYIVGVGGLLGIGDRYVAVTPTALTIRWDVADKAYQAVMDATADQLKAAPEFRFGDLSKAKP